MTRATGVRMGRPGVAARAATIGRHHPPATAALPGTRRRRTVVGTRGAAQSAWVRAESPHRSGRSGSGERPRWRGTPILRRRGGGAGGWRRMGSEGGGRRGSGGPSRSLPLSTGHRERGWE
ncbi:MAG: hypothetical protein AVDCRST_MAG59-2925 [uncultured Thermomicrobiales bacterium]|uniref:Uncharacterized protein n=1 Tax=uncultured Thermomicrobiales bacterium TaxID=1645740 RepID=A0A6J4V4Y7_9BACT|nr:MAG: hypothetical protein AVDCRST_MAG59-2925 [uncultured Thermomicrobiales bacterium]